MRVLDLVNRGQHLPPHVDTHPSATNQVPTWAGQGCLSDVMWLVDTRIITFTSYPQPPPHLMPHS
jgi:hypothetical protein